jgi:hypothetical protein
VKKEEIFVVEQIDEESEEEHPHTGTQLMNNMSQGCSQASMEPFMHLQPKEDKESIKTTPTKRALLTKDDLDSINIEKIMKAARKLKTGDVKTEEENGLVGKKRKHKRSKDSHRDSKRMKHF